MQMLVDYLDNHVSKTEVVNQLLEVGTPDAYKVVEAVNMLEQTVSDQEPADLSEITALLRSVLQETEKIPKSHNDIKIPEQVDNSDKLEKLESAIKAVDASIKAQKLVAEAPIVNVPEAVVNVDKPDLSPIEQEQKKTRTDLVKAIKGIVIPKTDIKPLEKELKKLNKLFNEFVEYGTGSSGGGGGGGGGGLTDAELRATPVPTTINNTLVPEKHDEIQATYPTTSSEVYTYKLSGVSVAVVTVTYADATKEVLTSVVRS